MNKTKKTFIILTPGFAASETDTNCLPAQQAFIRALNKNYPQLTIIIIAFQYPYYKKKYDWYGNTVISLSGRNKGGLKKLILRRKINRELKKLTTQSEVTGLLSFWLNECAYVGKKFADKNNLKHFCWLWGQDARKGNKYVSILKTKPDELITLSDFLQCEFQKNYSIQPSHVIPYAVNPIQFKESTFKRDIDILGAGSLIPLKQFEIFLEIVAVTKKQFPHIKAVLAGAGHEEHTLQQLIIELGLQENIRMTGELPHHELLQLMQRTKIFLHPSSYEGFSGVCMEALYAGAQVVSFCRAMNEEIPHWHIVNSKDEMRSKAIEILNDTTIEFSRVSPYDLDESVHRMMELYK